ncbi:MAG: beta-galactosidase, partial [Terriglobales bacterium]
TTGPAAAVALHPERTSIAADGQDVSVVSVAIHDAQGRAVPTADNEVQFALEGPGRIIGVGNGNPSSHEADKPDPKDLGRAARRQAFNGWCCLIVQSLRAQPGAIALRATSSGLTAGAASITSS